MDRLEVKALGATSPTLAEVMRVCQLRAGLARAPGASAHVLGNPKVWLGVAYHEVLATVANSAAFTGSLEAEVERLWVGAVDVQYKRAQGHLLDQRFGPASTWPGYHLARASVLFRAREMIGAQRVPPAHAPAGPRERTGDFRSGGREKTLVALGERLIGRPDVIRGQEIIDYKSGGVLEYDDETEQEVVNEGYVRQLRIYGYLVKETLGWWPRRGVLLPLVGAGVSVELDPQQCEREARAAVELLDNYNRQVAPGTSPFALASPSPPSCQWCRYKIFCPAFWREVSPSWSANLSDAAVEGTVTTITQPSQSNTAAVVSLVVDAGTEPSAEIQIGPLNTGVHQVVRHIRRDDRVRVVGLRRRQDGTVVAGQRTVMGRVSDLPVIRVGS